MTYSSGSLLFLFILICNPFNNLHFSSPEYNRSAFSHWVNSANRSINSPLKVSYTCNEQSTRLKLPKSKRLWHRTQKKEHHCPTAFIAFVQCPSLHLQLSQPPTSFITTSFSPHFSFLTLVFSILLWEGFHIIFCQTMLLFHHDSVWKLLDEFEHVVKCFLKKKS